MIALSSNLHLNLKQALIDAATPGDYQKWSTILKDKSNYVADGFLALLEHGFPQSATTEPSFLDLDDWLTHAEQWRQDRMLNPSSARDTTSLILYHLWDQFTTLLIALLRKARLESDIPKNGGLLVFVGGLSRCLIFRYQMIGETPRLHIVGIVKNPKSAFDFWGAIDQADMASRNHLKAILSTGHKLVVHRGILIHVDRRKDSEVFGPSIDTLVLSEILAQQIFELESSRFETAMEIGCGNGLLTTAIANHSKNLKELFAFDINFGAIACTRRNLFSSFAFPAKSKTLSPYLITGPFLPELISRRFDLIVCNPPYIPIPPDMTKRTQVADYFQAVGGTNLMKLVLKSADTLLKPNGKILLMTSSLSLNEALSYIPSTCTTSLPLGDDGFEVLFDVEAALNRPEWLSFLVEHCGLEFRDHLYYHELHPIWVQLPAS